MPNPTSPSDGRDQARAVRQRDPAATPVKRRHKRAWLWRRNHEGDGQSEHGRSPQDGAAAGKTDTHQTEQL